MNPNYNYIVLNDSSWHNRIHALEHVNNPEILLKVALYDYDYRIRSNAIKKISNQIHLFQIALKEKDTYIACQAIRKIESPDKLKDIILKRNEEEIQFCAISKITNDKILKDLLIIITYPSVISKIISLLSDEDALLNIALYGSCLYRIDAIKRILELNKQYSMNTLRQRKDYLVRQYINDK